MKHIAIIRISSLGDVAMIVPLLIALKKKYPDVKITVVSKSFYKPIFKSIERVDFFSVDLKHQHKGFLGIFRLFFSLRKMKIDGLADFHHVLRSDILRYLFFFTKTKTAFTNKYRKARKRLTRKHHKIVHPIASIHHNHQETLKKLGFPVSLSKHDILIPQQLSSKIVSLFGEKNTAWIGVAPFSYYASKEYPLDLMKELIVKLAKHYSKIFIFGNGPLELEKSIFLKQDLKNVFIVQEELEFSEELILISNLNLMLSMDSANGHLAANYGVKVVTIWGGTHPYCGFTPFAQCEKHQIIPDRNLFPHLPTSIYGNKTNKNYEEQALRSISPQYIYKRIEEIMEC